MTNVIHYLCCGGTSHQGSRSFMVKAMKAQSIQATQFRAELWTTVSEKEIWATVMLDGSDAGWPCAFGPKQRMRQYASQLNESKGIIQS